MARPEPLVSAPFSDVPIFAASASSTHQTEPETLEHLLSLPPLLEPISPPLAALHLARIRLALSIPTFRRSGGLTEFWCHSCGGLREGLGGAQPVKSKGTKRVHDQVECDLSTEGESLDISSFITVIKLQPSPISTPSPERYRKKPNCTQCGASYLRPKADIATLAQLIPARTAARTIKTRGMSTLITPGAIRGTESTPAPAMIRTTESEVGPSPSFSLATPHGIPDPALDIGQQSNHLAPSLLSTPRLSYLPSSEPNPPTYPKPPGRSSPPPTNNKGAKRKKRPASGLAKLLAEAKERDSGGQAGAQSGSSWGLV